MSLKNLSVTWKISICMALVILPSLASFAYQLRVGKDTEASLYSFRDTALSQALASADVSSDLEKVLAMLNGVLAADRFGAQQAVDELTKTLDDLDASMQPFAAQNLDIIGPLRASADATITTMRQRHENQALLEQQLIELTTAHTALGEVLRPEIARATTSVDFAVSDIATSVRNDLSSFVERDIPYVQALMELNAKASIFAADVAQISLVQRVSQLRQWDAHLNESSSRMMALADQLQALNPNASFAKIVGQMVKFAGSGETGLVSMRRTFLSLEEGSPELRSLDRQIRQAVAGISKENDGLSMGIEFALQDAEATLRDRNAVAIQNVGTSINSLQEDGMERQKITLELLADVNFLLGLMREIPNLRGEELATGIDRMSALGAGLAARRALLSPQARTVFDEFLSFAEAQSIAATVQNTERIEMIAQETLVAADVQAAASSEALKNVTDAVATATVAEIGVLLERIKGSTFSIIASIVAILVLFGLTQVFLIYRGIVRELGAAVKSMGVLAKGDGEFVPGDTDRGDEVGDIWKALTVFKNNLDQNKKLANESRLAEEEKRKLMIETEEERRRAEEAATAERERAEKAAAESRAAMMQTLGNSIGLVVGKAKAGDFSSRVEATFEDQTLTTLSSNVNDLMKIVDDGLSEAGNALAHIADGDLTQPMKGHFEGAFKDLQDNTNAMIGALKDLIGDISESTDNVANSSTELSSTSSVLSQQAEQNAAALENSSGALEKFSSSIKQVGQSIKSASSDAKVAKDTATEGGAVAAEAAEAMQKINAASTEISQVVSVISDISFQINLLALNAGVEAARAGDAGLGFSVVAAEVRQLAQRASDAVKEISDVIARSDSAVSVGVAKVSDAETSLRKITENFIGVSDRIQEVAQVISEQVTGVSKITSAVAQIDQNTQRQAAAFEEVTAASGLLSDEAKSLQHATSRFRTGSNVIHLNENSAKPSVSNHALL